MAEKIDPTIITFRWSANLDTRLRDILTGYRNDPGIEVFEGDIARSRAYEKKLLNKTLNWILLALKRSADPSLDCDLIDRLDRLKIALIEAGLFREK